MIEVTQQDDKTFTISWDENDPQESIFNDYTEEDFINLIQNYLKSLEESTNININQVTEAVNNINDHIEEEIIATCEETFGEECYDEEFWEDYHNNKHSDKSKAISRRLKEIYKERNTLYEFIDQTAEDLFQDLNDAEKVHDWYSVKEEAIREYQSDQLSQDRTLPPPDNFPLFP